MNVVFAITTFLAVMTTSVLLVIPRVLYFFGLRVDALDALISPWATFIILMIAGGFAMAAWVKGIKGFVLASILVIAAAAMLTFYFCQLPLPW